MEVDWKPLEKVLGKARCAGFMFMGRVNGINLYKHGISRSYLNLDDDGNCYVKGSGVAIGKRISTRNLRNSKSV